MFHGSTVLYPTAEDLHAHRVEFSYGRHGSPTTRAVLVEALGSQSFGIRLLGVCAGPDDVFLALRGTLSVRLAQHYRSGLDMARWHAARPAVLRVLHPALESHPGHAIWKRDFTGASGLFSIVLKPVSQKAVDALLDAVKLFGMGYSWGGFESLVIPFDCDGYRTATKWSPGGPTLRLHIGLENLDDLKADLERGFAALRAAA